MNVVSRMENCRFKLILAKNNIHQRKFEEIDYCFCFYGRQSSGGGGKRRICVSGWVEYLEFSMSQVEHVILILRRTVTVLL